jgi:hypothetical protein
MGWEPPLGGSLLPWARDRPAISDDSGQDDGEVVGVQRPGCCEGGGRAK